MRKLYIFISYLFLFSFSIYAHSGNLFNALSETVKSLSEESAEAEVDSAGNIKLNISIELEADWEPCCEEYINELQIVRLLPEYEKNFNDTAWKKYKEEILAKYQDKYPSAIPITVSGSLLAIEDPQRQCLPISFYTVGIERNVSTYENNVLLNIMNRHPKYNFDTVNVKITDVGFGEYIKEGKLPVSILKNGDGAFFDDLKTDDTDIKITYAKPIMKIDMEYIKHNLGGFIDPELD
ncbi:MAG: hypothetical protein PUP46_04740 [Endozoicomonas sp. (ex Botrylloides leachii)]|nr:hypothetical protein [Endozoicomonas sp. (ex Botrylloides leachii)]